MSDTLIKWVAAIFVMLGWAVITFNLLFGLILACIGSAVWIYVGAKIMKEPSVSWMNAFFVVVQLIGIINILT